VNVTSMSMTPGKRVPRRCRPMALSRDSHSLYVSSWVPMPASFTRPAGPAYSSVIGSFDQRHTYHYSISPSLLCYASIINLDIAAPSSVAVNSMSPALYMSNNCVLTTSSSYSLKIIFVGIPMFRAFIFYTQKKSVADAFDAVSQKLQLNILNPSSSEKNRSIKSAAYRVNKNWTTMHMSLQNAKAHVSAWTRNK
jgi:hypothetical protein